MSLDDLVRHLAHQEVVDWIYSDRWMGFPNPDNEGQMAEAEEIMIPRAVSDAKTYKELLER